MQAVEKQLEDSATVQALGADDLAIVVDAFNRLGSTGPGLKAAAERLGRIVPELR
jgi:hypothetical protein